MAVSNLTPSQYIVIHRVEPKTQRGYLLVAHTAFQKGSKDAGYSEHIFCRTFFTDSWPVTPVQLRRTKVKFIFGASLEISSYDDAKDTKLIKGLDSKLCLLPPVEGKDGSDGDGPYQEITVPGNFPPGSVMLFSTQLEGLDPQMDDSCKKGVDEAFAGLNLTDLNAILYRCENEERDATGENDIPSRHRKLTFI
jgi:glycogen debranching enzyme